MKTKRKTVLISALLAVLVLATVFLFACNKPATSGDKEYGVYIRRTLYNPTEGVMTVYASLSSDERMTIENATANWHYVKSDYNAFYYRYDYTVSFSPKTLFSVIKDSLTQEQLIMDGVEYKVLKLVFEYATIYKSLESDGNVFVSDGQYVHDFPIDENLTINYGRLGEEAVRIKEIVNEADDKTLILFNETYSTTSAADGLYLSKDLLRVLKEYGTAVIFNTHIHEVARSLDEMNQWDGKSRFVSLVMEIKDNVNTFHVKRSDPESKSYARNIAEKYGITYEQMKNRE